MREMGARQQEQLQELMVAERMTSSSPPPQGSYDVPERPHRPSFPRNSVPKKPVHYTPLPQDGERYLQYQRGLLELHRQAHIPPAVKILNGEVTKVGELAVTGGTYSDVWMGSWLGGEKVALKSLRNIKASDTKAQKVCYKANLTYTKQCTYHTYPTALRA